MKEGWEVKRLGEVCEITMGQSPSSESYNDIGRGMPFFQGCSDFGKLYPHVTTYCDMPKKMADINDVLISVRAPIGTLNIANLHCCIGRGLASVREIKGLSCYKYLYFFLLKSKEELQEKGTGATFKAIGKDALLNFPILVPSIEEQSRIVEELDLLSNIIEKKRQQLSEIDNLAQSIFYDMFGDPNSNDKQWERVKFDSICKNLDCQRKPITAKDRLKGNIPYYGASGIVDYVKDYIFDGDFLLISEDGANLSVRHTPIAFRITGKTWVNNHAHIVQFDDIISMLFVEYYINLLDISDLITGCAQPKLTQANLNNILIFDVPLKFQQLFAQKIEAVEKQKGLIKQSIAETEELFNSRMDYYFS